MEPDPDLPLEVLDLAPVALRPLLDPPAVHDPQPPEPRAAIRLDQPRPDERRMPVRQLSPAGALHFRTTSGSVSAVEPDREAAWEGLDGISSMGAVPILGWVCVRLLRAGQGPERHAGSAS